MADDERPSWRLVVLHDLTGRTLHDETFQATPPIAEMKASLWQRRPYRVSLALVVAP